MSLESRTARIKQRFDELKTLEDNWYYGKSTRGLIYDSDAVDLFSDCLIRNLNEQDPDPYIFPSCNGELVLEWFLDNSDIDYEIRFHQEYKQCVLTKYYTNDEQECEYVTFDVNDDVTWKKFLNDIRLQYEKVSHGCKH